MNTFFKFETLGTLIGLGVAAGKLDPNTKQGFEFNRFVDFDITKDVNQGTCLARSDEIKVRFL